MKKPVRRSVTFFFVPLIDVLILMFCIFLLLPIVSKPDSEKPGKEADGGLPTDVAELQQRVLIAEKRVADLMADRAKEAERTVVPVLQVDGKDGRLFYYDKPATVGSKEQFSTKCGRLAHDAWPLNFRPPCRKGLQRPHLPISFN